MASFDIKGFYNRLIRNSNFYWNSKQNPPYEWLPSNCAWPVGVLLYYLSLLHHVWAHLYQKVCCVIVIYAIVSWQEYTSNWFTVWNKGGTCFGVMTFTFSENYLGHSEKNYVKGVRIGTFITKWDKVISDLINMKFYYFDPIQFVWKLRSWPQNKYHPWRRQFESRLRTAQISDFQFLTPRPRPRPHPPPPPADIRRKQKTLTSHHISYVRAKNTCTAIIEL